MINNEELSLRVKELANEYIKFTEQNQASQLSASIDPKIIAYLQSRDKIAELHWDMIDMIWKYSGRGILSLAGWINAVQRIVSLLFALITTLAMFMLLIYICYIFEINPKIILGNVLWMAGLFVLIFGGSLWGSINYIGKLFNEKVVSKQAANEVDAIFDDVKKK
jgi:hypothetical protein